MWDDYISGYTPAEMARRYSGRQLCTRHGSGVISGGITILDIVDDVRGPFRNHAVAVCLSASCLCPAVHADGTREYDAHNLFGTAMAVRNTKAATEIIGKRPFFILR